MAESPLRLIVGLGNPGPAYRSTRHNMGFLVADVLARVWGVPLGRKKFEVAFGRGNIRQHVRVVLGKPLTYMNRSGLAVRRLADFFGIQGKDLLVIHDDLDLPFGKIRIKEKGGHGGHKGLKSLTEA
ncbi:aminoacyl-tRNA hydrolase, partial [Thermodesulfobacteriota bacterium]